MLFYSNTFTTNAAYYDTSVISVRIQSADIFTESISDSTLKCYGVRFQENTFTKNFGCPAFGGPTINLECYDPDVASLDDKDQLTLNLAPTSALIDGWTYFDYSTLTASSITTYTYDSTTISIDLYKIDFNANTF